MEVFLEGREFWAVMTGTAMWREGRGSRMVDGRTCPHTERRWIETERGREDRSRHRGKERRR